MLFTYCSAASGRESGASMISLYLNPLIERLRVFLNSPRLTAVLAGALMSLFPILVADADARAKNKADLLALLLGGHLSSVLFRYALAALVLVLILRWLFDWYRTRRGDDALLAKLLAKHVDPVIAPFADGVVSFGSALTLLLAPDLREGWPLKEVKVHYTGDAFSFPPGDRDNYKSYFDANFEAKRFFNNGVKYCIRKNPAAFTDTPTLELEIEKTCYSQVQYCRDCIATVASRRNKLIADSIETNKILFPHALCMHAVIVSSDEKVLMVRRSPKVSYYPNAWSVSLEEQLSEKDAPIDEGVLLRWSKRFLLEELGVLEEHYEERNLRATAVFLEGELLNCSIAALFKLSIKASQLQQIIRTQPRADAEFDTNRYRFLTLSEVAAELFNPTVPLHPTSQYRMLLYLYHEYGGPRLAKMLFKRQA